MICTRCKCYNSSYNVNCIPFSGNPNADLYFIGEMAGMNEAKASEKMPTHFIGEAGQIFNRLLEQNNIYRDDVAIANSLRCYKDMNVTPTKSELDACFMHTLREVNKINPKLIVSMGATAFYQATGNSDFTPNIGRVLFSKKLNRKVYVVNHPAAVLYDESKMSLMEEQFSNILTSIDHEPFKPKHFPFVLVESMSKYVMKKLQASENLYTDIESTGLSPYYEYLRLLQIGTNEKEIFVLTEKVLKDNTEFFIELFKEKGVIGAGFEFDAKFLNVRYNIEFPIYKFDVVLAEFLLSGMKENDLSSLTEKYAPEYAGYDDEVKAAGGAHKIKDFNKLLQYAGNDIGVMYAIHKTQHKRLVKQGMSWLYYNITLPCNKVLTDMSLRGVLIDTDKVQELTNLFTRRAEKALMKAESLDAIQACEIKFRKKFNPRSSDLVKWILLDYYELPVLATTKLGNPSVGQKEMEEYAEKYGNDYCKYMSKYRSYHTIISNFLSGLLPKLVDNVAHTTYGLHGTSTGRSNSKDPNLLNFPSKKEYKDVKSCIIARPGFKFIAADMAQIEMRVAAVMYDDQNLIDLCNDTEKGDFHSIITSKVYDIPYDKVYKAYKAGDVDMTDLRKRCKNISFGILYQEGPEALAYDMGVTLQEAEAFIKEYFKSFPDLEKNIEKQKRFTIKHGYAESFFGFRRRWAFHTKDDHATLRECVNMVVQSTSWNILELSLIKMAGLLKDMKSEMVLQVYDQIVVETHGSEIEAVSFLIKDVMENIHKPYDELNRVKFKVDVEMGTTLGNLKS